jgi:hypothetical protein
VQTSHPLCNQTHDSQHAIVMIVAIGHHEGWVLVAVELHPHIQQLPQISPQPQHLKCESSIPQQPPADHRMKVRTIWIVIERSDFVEQGKGPRSLQITQQVSHL